MFAIQFLDSRETGGLAEISFCACPKMKTTGDLITVCIEHLLVCVTANSMKCFFYVFPRIKITFNE